MLFQDLFFHKKHYGWLIKFPGMIMLDYFVHFFIMTSQDIRYTFLGVARSMKMYVKK